MRDDVRQEAALTPLRIGPAACLSRLITLLGEGVRQENVEKDWKKYWKLQDL
jgi:hypothetical protein